MAISHSGAIPSVLLVLGRFLPPEVSILIQNQAILITKHVYGAKKLLSLVSNYYYVFGPKGGASASIAPPLNPPLCCVCVCVAYLSVQVLVCLCECVFLVASKWFLLLTIIPI